MAGDVKPPPQGGGNAVDGKIVGILICAALFASLAVVPYLIEISRATGKDVAVWELTVSTVTEHMILAAIAIGIGLTLGPKVNLGTPLLCDCLSRKAGWARRGRSPVVAALVGGIGIGVVLSLVDPWLKTFMPEWPESARRAEEIAENMPAWKPLLASFSAGVTEELLFRFGLMTLLVWLGVRIRHRTAPGSAVLWTANLSTALLFGLAHLANVVELGIPITPGTVLYVTLTNGIAGVVLGWLYGRHGLSSAITAHVIADVVVKVVVPIITTGPA